METTGKQSKAVIFKGAHISETTSAVTREDV
jgi:hypothetical protein